jgi:hypothetical protein
MGIRLSEVSMMLKDVFVYLHYEKGDKYEN